MGNESCCTLYDASLSVCKIYVLVWCVKSLFLLCPWRVAIISISYLSIIECSNSLDIVATSGSSVDESPPFQKNSQVSQTMSIVLIVRGLVSVSTYLTHKKCVTAFSVLFLLKYIEKIIINKNGFWPYVRTHNLIM